MQKGETAVEILVEPHQEYDMIKSFRGRGCALFSDLGGFSSSSQGRAPHQGWEAFGPTTAA